MLAARSDVKAKAAQVARIKRLLASSKEAADRAQRAAEEKGAAYQGAVARVDAAAARIATIQQQVDAEARRAAEATQRAGQLAAQLSRTGGTDPRTTLFLSGGDDGADDFLSRLGRLSKLTEANGAIADEAEKARNASEATQAQLTQAKEQLVGLRDRARAAYDSAVRASAEADAQVRKQQAAQVELQARLDALEATSEAVAKQYERGVRERRARARAAARAAAAPSAGGAVVTSGWAKPAYGPITAGFGPRPDRPAGANAFHRGTDIGAAYGSPIYAAHAGTVTYAGPFGTYGNWIEVDDGDGTQTGYAHIRPGGIFVRVGERVSAGQNIASVGATGAATGPHLHFETRISETAVNAVPFMAERGVTLG